MIKLFKIPKKDKNFFKIITLLLVIVIIILLVPTLYIFNLMDYYGDQYIVSMEELPTNCDAILVLGAGLTSDGTPSDILKDRLSTALKISQNNNCTKFILSGEHGKESYNEVGAMKKYLLDNGIDESNLFMDHAGFNTYNSMYRAKEIFEVDKLILVTNTYHLPRSLYLSRKLDIESYGISSDIRNYWGMTNYKFRERLAQIKDYVNINILKPEPIFLGQPIPVNSSDGRDTND